MRILFVTTRPPWPSRRGDQARTAGFVRELGARHEIAVVALRPPGFPATPFPDGVTGRTVELGRADMLAGLVHGLRRPLQVALHETPRLERAVHETIESFRPDVVVPVLSRVGRFVRDRVLRDPAHSQHGVPAVIDLVDSLKLNMENRARHDPWLRPLLGWEARRIGAWEAGLARDAAATTVVSERDRRAIVGNDPELAGKVHVVPFGLDVPDLLPEPSAPGEILILTGNLGYFPTVDGAGWFAREVWPRIRAERPDAEWCLAGSRPVKAIRRLAELPGVRLVVEPEDLTALRRRAAVAVVPLRSGSGTPIKILEALAEGLPVATTSAGRQGLDEAPDGAVAAADDPAELAGTIARLLADPEGAARQRRIGWNWVRRRHGLGRVARAFETLLEGAVRRPAPA